MANEHPKTEDVPDAFVRVVMRYLDGLATAAEFEQVQQELRGSAAKRQVFVQMCQQAQALSEGLSTQGLVGSELTDETLDEEPSDVFLEVIEQALHARKLHELEDLANQRLAEDLRLQQDEARLARARSAQMPKPSGPRVIVIPKAVAYLGTGLAAALVALAVYLVAAPDRSSAPPGDPGVTAQLQQPQPVRVQPGEPRYVAELLHVSEDAVWADQSAGWVAGMRLEAGELNLTQGRIALRLMDGAEVTLQAPVRYSVLNTNHSELHFGRLTAVVPDSAKGFEVLIPGGVVTDLGTAFFLDVADDESSQPSHVEVTRGLVTVATRRSGRRGEPVPLRPEQFASVPQDGGEIEAFRYTNQSVWIDVPSTGVGLQHTQADWRWTIRAADDPQEYAALVVAPEDWADPDYQHLLWLPGDAKRSHWIALDRAGDTGNALDSDDGSGTLNFATTLVIPEYIDPASVELRLKIIADNRLVAIRVNGEKVAGPFDLPNPDLSEMAQEQYRTWLERTLKSCFQTGENTLEFEVYNTNGPSGIRVEMSCLGTQVYTPIESR